MGNGFWKTLFRPATLRGTAIEYAHAWQVSAPPRPIRLALALRVLLSADGGVALEGTSIARRVREILQPHEVPPALAIRPGTLYPTPEWIHIHASDDALTTLNELVDRCAGPEICNHLYAYEKGVLLLEWHDAFGDPIHVAGTVPAAVVAAFCSALGVGPAQPASYTNG